MNPKTIVTHDGNFHADDVFSVAAFKTILPSFNLVRTRDLELIANADIAIDVGGEYSPNADRFDHHQRGGAGERRNGIPYSSFGLIWRKYGLNICQGDQNVANYVDAELVSSIDSDDCGYTKGVYKGVSLSDTISMFNPTWLENRDVDESFNEAVEFASRVLTRSIASAKAVDDAKEIVRKAIDRAEDLRVIVLKNAVPWKQVIHTLSEKTLYVIYPSRTGKWRIQTVSVEPGSFENKKTLPKQWAGLSGKEFREATGIDDAIFCHDGLFTAGAESLEGAMRMASIALKEL